MLSAVVVAGLSLALLRRLGVRALDGSAIGLAPKAMGGGYRYWIGGTLFGVGWAVQDHPWPDDGASSSL